MVSDDTFGFLSDKVTDFFVIDNNEKDKFKRGVFKFDDLSFSFSELELSTFNIVSFELNFVYSLDSKVKISKEKILSSINQFNKIKPAVKVVFNKQEKKDIHVSFRAEFVFANDENSMITLNSISPASLVVLSNMPIFFSEHLTSNGVSHAGIVKR